MKKPTPVSDFRPKSRRLDEIALPQIAAPVPTPNAVANEYNWEVVDEYNPLWPNEYEKLVKERREKREEKKRESMTMKRRLKSDDEEEEDDVPKCE